MRRSSDDASTQQTLLGRSLLVGTIIFTAAASDAQVVAPNINISRITCNHKESAIVADPLQPNRLAAFSNTELDAGLLAAYSVDGGSTWIYSDATDPEGSIADGDVGDPLPEACCDPTTTWDEFGNLFLAYIDNNPVGQVRTSRSVPTAGITSCS